MAEQFMFIVKKEGNEDLSMSNYEITKNRVLKEFVKYDQEKMIKKFHLKYDESYVYVDFFNHRYRIHRVEGTVTWVEIPEESSEQETWEKEQEANFNEVLTIFDVLCDSKDGCAASGEFVNMKSLSSIKGSTGNVGGSLFQSEAKFFDDKMEALADACERLKGVKKGRGDVAYEIPVFNFLSFMIQFWESDDEFDANLEIFVDKNILQFMRYETMWYAVSHMLDRMKKEIDRENFR